MTALVTKTELARIAGVTPAAITKASVKTFAGAMVGPRVDLDHPDVRRYLANKDQAQTRLAERLLSPPASPPADYAPASSPPRPPSPPATQGATAPARTLSPVNAFRPAPVSSEPAGGATEDNIERYADLTLRELTTLFGTAQRFGDWLKARKIQSEVREKDLRHDERLGLLVPRETVRVHVFGYIDRLHRRLLTDAAKSIARRLYAAAAAGLPIEEAESIARDLIAKPLGETKSQTLRVLADPSDVDEHAKSA